mmetsp:Transcript_14270/g.23066  ORF Transcript_14270/g.23066 Transcript_14270/m.23066 type:complete len:81 (+) Transcript_14270:290-532(+)
MFNINKANKQILSGPTTVFVVADDMVLGVPTFLNVVKWEHHQPDLPCHAEWNFIDKSVVHSGSSRMVSTICCWARTHDIL